MEDLRQFRLKLESFKDLSTMNTIIVPQQTNRQTTKSVRETSFDDFMERNPMAGGGMLVQPSADGSRPGYANRCK